MIGLMARVSGKQQPGVLIYRPVDESGASHRRLEAVGCRVEIADSGTEIDAALDAAGPVNALLAATLRGRRLDRKLLDSLPELRIVAKYTVGVDDVDVEAATALGVLVTHSPTEANTGGVAEGTVALALALLKKIQIRSAAVKAGQWRSDALRGTYLGARDDGYPGLTLGIVGLGRVGRRVAELMRPWKVTLIATDPYIERGAFQRAGVDPVDLDELLRRSDIVSLHCPLSAETQNLIGAAELAKMKASAVLINTARGRIVDIDALCDALDAGRLAGAALDVLPEEPPPRDARILRSDARVILSPHMVAANQGGTLAAAIPWATAAVIDALSGRVPERVYNASAIDAWQARFEGDSLIGPGRKESA